MSEDKGSKTEEATPKKKEEAFEQGNFAKTQDLGTAFIMLGAMVSLAFGLSFMTTRIGRMGRSIFEQVGTIELNIDNAAYFVGGYIQECLLIITPFLLICMIMGVLAGGLQSGFKITPKVLGFKWDRLDFSNGFSNVISKKKLIQGLGDLAKLIAVGVVIYGCIRQIGTHPIFTSPVPLIEIPGFIYETFSLMMYRLILILFVLATCSYIYQRYKVNKDLMMTKQEVRDEAKQQDGDPMMKSARRALGRQLLQKQMLSDVATADVVVTNPTHYAVALRYETGKDSAPIVVAKGDNMFAKRIKAVAKENGVPMVENKPVARMLFKVGKVGESIPPALYQVVAEILTEVYRKHKYYFHRLKGIRAQRN